MHATNFPPEVSRESARLALLIAQGIEHQRPPATKAGVRAAIQMMGQLQIDTIHVVARSPYFVLWTRLGHYDPTWLDELLAEKAIFEAWSHEACFLPIEDFAFARARSRFPVSFRRRIFEYLEENRVEADRLLRYVRENGAVRSSDFAAEPGTSGGWWNWKEEKVLLEALFTEGSLMVDRRDRFQRVYDVRERVLPEWDEERTATHEAMVRAHVLHSVRALGVAAASWIPDYYRFKVGEVAPVIRELAASGELITTQIEGVKGPAFVHPDQATMVQGVAERQYSATRTTLMSPFDPVAWHRKRAEELFDFSYLIECYTPSHKRIYGYFSLPILHRGAIVGRLDAKAHRRDRIFEIRSLHLEPWQTDNDQLAAELAQALLDCAVWHGTPKVEIRGSRPRGFAPQLRAAMKAIRRGHT
ncbi:MAG: winged helix-turn-helix domain-containing protein [Thermomicrobiales bacterium]